MEAVTLQTLTASDPHPQIQRHEVTEPQCHSSLVPTHTIFSFSPLTQNSACETSIVFFFFALICSRQTME